MATLGRIAQFDRRTTVISWRVNGQAFDLTDATFAGWKEDKSGEREALDGTLFLHDGPTGAMAWTKGAEDTGTPGLFQVQFRATIDGIDYFTLPARWEVVRSLVVEVEP